MTITTITSCNDTLPRLAQLPAPIAATLETTTAAAVRLDERVGRAGRVGGGYRSRIEYQGACAPVRLSTIELRSPA